MKRAPNARWTRIFGLAGLLTLLRRVRRRADAKELAIESREQLFSMLVRNADDIYVMFSPDAYEVEYVSPNVEKLLGVSVEAVKNNIRALSDSAADPSSDPRIDDIASLEEGECLQVFRERIQARTGERRWYQETLYRESIKGVDKYVLVLSDRTNEQKGSLMLEQALDIARSSNEAKSQFLANMSHDIRTPINAIVGMTAIAGLHMDDQMRIADCLKKITISSKLLLNLINEVLDMSKLESDKIMLTEEAFKINELLESLFVMVQPAFEAKKQKFQIHVTKIKHECLIGDVQRIQQALLNMLTNAIKYTPEDGQIQLTVEEKPSVYNGYGQFEITVTDNGIGMKPEFLEKVFEPFERSDDKAIRNIQGTGLGMAISRHIAQIMNGDILVESEYGKGSKFTMRFHVKLGSTNEYDNNILVDLPVLVVDDDEVSCEIAYENLQELGMKPEWVLSGEKAVQKVIDGDTYFAIIIDLMMPGMNGIETTIKIREYVEPDTPIIIISAYDYSGYEFEAVKAGVNGFISKPIIKSKLFHLMKKICLRQKGRRASPYHTDSYHIFSRQTDTGRGRQ